MINNVSKVNLHPVKNKTKYKKSEKKTAHNLSFNSLIYGSSYKYSPFSNIKITDKKNQSDYLIDCITREKIVNKKFKFTGSDINNLFFKETINESSEKRKKSFERIYNEKSWGTNFDLNIKDSRSGKGSTLNYAQEIIAVLHILINKIKENKPEGYRVRLLDAPCGDFVWMKRFLETRNDVEYTGVDIVKELIINLKNQTQGTNYKFFQEDIVEMKKLPYYDIILSRMFTQHLYFSDVFKFLKLVSSSGSGYFVSTLFPNNKENSNDFKGFVGRFRPLNLLSEPFCLTPPSCLTLDGVYTSAFHFIGVWKLPLSFVMKPFKNKMPINSKLTIYSCFNFNN